MLSSGLKEIANLAIKSEVKSNQQQIAQLEFRSKSSEDIDRAMVGNLNRTVRKIVQLGYLIDLR